MKNSTFETRTKSVAKNSNGYKLTHQLLTTPGKVRTCWTSGSGRFTTNVDYQKSTIEVLVIAGLVRWQDFREGNDAPRGGATGQYIELTPRGRRKMLN